MSTEAFIQSDPGRRYMARLNATRWIPQPFRVTYSKGKLDSRRVYTGQGVKLAIRHESGRVFASAKDAEREMGIASTVILNNARKGTATRLGKFEIVAA